MPPTTNSKKLGRLVRAQREARSMSLREVAEQVPGTDAPYLLRLERGEYRTPHPAILQGLADALDLQVAELYGLAGYPMPKGLPSLPVFLRSTMDLPERKIAEIEALINKLRDETGPSGAGPKGGRRGRPRR